MDRHAWERPGAHEEAPGVYRIPLPLPGDHLKAVNVYAIADGDHVVMIDGGWALAESEELLTASLGQIGYGLGDIREFLVTHIHRDHYTQAVAVRRAFGTPVALGEGERASLEAIHTITVHPDIAKLYAAGALGLSKQLAEWRGDPELTNWESPDRWLTDGIDIALTTRTLRVIATPGHTRGHVVFYDVAANALFAGDHVLPHITPSIGFELVAAQSPLRDYLTSLQLVRALPDARLLPAHGPTTDSTHARVEALLGHHEERLAATAKAVANGASTAFEVANALTWTRHRRAFDDLDMFNQIMAVHETMAHLEVLAERGGLNRSVADGIVRFAAG
jgi:glyoxylase-like metal-dependent hydrolase (beta-lactamase superfamily II)